MGIIFQDGALVFRGGALALSTDCCCNEIDIPGDLDCNNFPDCLEGTQLLLTISGLADGPTWEGDCCFCGLSNDAGLAQSFSISITQSNANGVYVLDYLGGGAYRWDAGGGCPLDAPIIAQGWTQVPCDDEEEYHNIYNYLSRLDAVLTCSIFNEMKMLGNGGGINTYFDTESVCTYRPSTLNWQDTIYSGLISPLIYNTLTWCISNPSSSVNPCSNRLMTITGQAWDPIQTVPHAGACPDAPACDSLDSDTCSSPTGLVTVTGKLIGL
jgi:hypothetical protein